MKVGTLLKNLGLKVKIDLSDAKYADLLSANLEIPDDVATALENGLLDLDTAKTNPEVNKHIRGRALNAIDDKVNELLEEYQLSAEDAAEIKSQASSYNKLPLLAAKIKAKIASENTGSTDSKKIKAEYDKLNGDMLELKKVQATEIEKIKNQSEQAILDYAIDAHLGALQYANSDLAPEINVLTAKNVLMKKLTDSKAKIVRGADGKLQLKNSEIPELDYQENNKAISFSDLTASTLASNKLLKVSDAPANNQPRKTNQQPDNNGKRVDVSNVSNMLREEARQLAESNK